MMFPTQIYVFHFCRYLLLKKLDELAQKISTAVSEIREKADKFEIDTIVPLQTVANKMTTDLGTMRLCFD